MNLLADESIEEQVVSGLRRDGYKVLYVSEMEPGISDDQVLRLANDSESLLITSDKDFGEMVFRLEMIHAGVVLTRLSGLSSETKTEIVCSAFRIYSTKFVDAFSVISPGSIRVRQKQLV